MRTTFLTIAAVTIAICSICLPEPAFGASKTFVVTTAVGANVPGSLTWAVYQANYGGADINYINFNIAGNPGGEIEITLTEPLYIARPMVINAASQSGSSTYAGPPLVRINCNQFASGFSVVPAASGLPGGGGSTIQGFRMINYSSNAITIFKGADSNLIANNEIGFAPSPGSSSYFRNITVAPLCRGIGIESNSNILRGNTISGVHNAITLGFDIATPTTSTARNNVFEHNFVGTDPTGTTRIGNDSDGIFLGAGCEQTLIGPGNVFSGNASAGVELLSATATNNRIFGNMIGLNAAGTEVIPNGELGVLIANGAANNWVGGPEGGPYPGNVISGSGYGGIAIGTDAWPGPDGSNDNHVEGNLIGTDAAETRAIGAQVSGVTVQSNSKRNIIRKNVIVGQTNHGVVFSNAANNEMYGNWIGVTRQGLMIGNGGFAVYLFNATNNIVQLSAANAGPGREQNFFGLNALGRAGLDGASVGNVIDLTPTPIPTPTATPSQLLNISTRMRVESGDGVLIAGFIITGTEPKKVIIRGIGPSLAGLPGTLTDPTLELHQGNFTMATNDNWKINDQTGQSQETTILATTLPPSNNVESAIVATLTPGAYTAVLSGRNGGTGIGVVEVYDLSQGANSKLANISSRGFVNTGDNVMIAGLIIGGGAAQSQVVFRALGPSLTTTGISTALNDPTLRLVNGNGVQVGQNDNWQDDAAQAAQLTALSMFPSSASESAIVANLSPGNYTAILADRNGNTGTGVLEVYHIQ